MIYIYIIYIMCVCVCIYIYIYMYIRCGAIYLKASYIATENDYLVMIILVS